MLDGIRVASQSFFGRAILAILMMLIVFSFAIFGIGDIFRGFGAGKVAQVGTTDVTSEQLRFAYQTDLQRLQRRAGRIVTNDEARVLGLDQQTLSRLLSEAALDEKAQALGLAMSDASLRQAISEDATFKNAAGQFDPFRFQELLRDNGFNERSFVRQQRAVYLRQEIAEAIAGKVATPRILLSAIDRFRNETRSLDYFILPPSAVENGPEPDDAALNAYFENHRAAFAAPETRKIVTLVVTPTALARTDEVSDPDAQKFFETVKDARFTTPEKRLVQQIVFPNEGDAVAGREKIKAGGDFESLIAERKLTSADVDLGLVKKSDIGNRAVADAAFASAEGTVSEPVKTQFGAVLVHVVRIEPAQVEPFAKVAASLKNEIARDRAKNQVRTLHDLIEDARASGKSLTEAGKAAGLDVRVLDGVDSAGRDSNGAPIANLTAGPELLKAAFASDVGMDNETVTTSDDGYVWFEVVGIDPARQRTLGEVRDKVLEQYRAEDTTRRLAEKASAIVEDVAKGAEFAKIAEANGLAVKHDGGVKRSGGADLPTNAIAPIFEVAINKAGTVPVPLGQLVFVVLDSATPNYDPDSVEAKNATEQMNTRFEQNLLQQYVSRVESDAGVRVNQSAVRAAIGGGGGDQ